MKIFFQAIIREANEEIGIKINREDLEILHIKHNIKKDVLNFVFKVNKYENKIINNEPDLCSELKWFDIDKLPENIILKIKEEITDIRNDIYYNYSK